MEEILQCEYGCQIEAEHKKWHFQCISLGTKGVGAYRTGDTDTNEESELADGRDQGAVCKAENCETPRYNS